MQRISRQSGFILAIIFILFQIMLVECASEKEKIKIGVVGPLTGEGATYGESMKRGFELAFKANSQVELIYEDSRLLPAQGLSAIKKLISADNVKVVLGAAASGVTLAMAPIAEKNRVILFSSISTSDELRDAGEYIFRNVPRNEIQGITAARFIVNRLGKKSVAILKKNDEYATNLSISFANEIERLGGRILMNEAYDPETVDFRSMILKIKTLTPQAVYIPANYQETGLILKQSLESGLRVIFVGGDGSYSPVLVKIAGNSAEGSYYTIMAVRQNSYYRDFEDKFKSEYGRDPDIYDAYAYEAASIVLTAIGNVGYDAKRIKDFLLMNNFEESLTGPLRFDQDGEVDREYGIVVVKNGQFENVEVSE